MLKHFLIASFVLLYLHNIWAMMPTVSYNDKNSQDSAKLIQINNIILHGNKMIAEQKYDSAIQIYSIADSLAILSNNLSSSAGCIHNIGLCYLHLGEYMKCKEYFEAAILLSKEIGDELKLARYQMSLGVLYKKLDMFDISMQNIMKSISIAEKYDNKELMATAYNAIAGIQNSLGDYKNALIYYFKVSNIFENQGNINELVKVYNNIGNVYKDSDSLQLSKYYFNKSLKINLLNTNKSLLITTYKNLGDVYSYENEADSAALFYKLALSISNEIGHISKSYNCLVALAKLELNYKNYNSVSNHLQDIEQLDKTNISNDLLLSYFEVSKMYYKEIHQFENAFQFSELYTHKKDEIFNIEKTKGINELKFQYETEKKDQTILYLNELDALKSQSLKSKNISLIIILAGFVMILVLAVFYIMAFRKKKKAYAYIQLLMQESRHRTQNNLQLLSSILSLQVEQVDESHKDAVMTAEYRVQSIVILNKQLDISESKDKILLYDYLFSLSEGLIDAYTSENHIQFHLNLDNILVHPHQAVHIGLIVNELITNSLKYAFHDINNPSINIECKLLDEKRCQLVIRDNGVGLKPGWEEKSRKSLGMSLVKDLCHQLHGNFIIENRDGFFFQILFKIQ